MKTQNPPVPPLVEFNGQLVVKPLKPPVVPENTYEVIGTAPTIKAPAMRTTVRTLKSTDPPEPVR